MVPLNKPTMRGSSMGSDGAITQGHCPDRHPWNAAEQVCDRFVAGDCRAFGVGAAYDAYNYAYVAGLLILLGGINGPFHSAMVSVLSRRPRAEGAHILAA